MGLRKVPVMATYPRLMAYTGPTFYLLQKVLEYHLGQVVVSHHKSHIIFQLKSQVHFFMI